MALDVHITRPIEPLPQHAVVARNQTDKKHQQEQPAPQRPILSEQPDDHRHVGEHAEIQDAARHQNQQRGR